MDTLAAFPVAAPERVGSFDIASDAAGEPRLIDRCWQTRFEHCEILAFMVPQQPPISVGLAKRLFEGLSHIEADPRSLGERIANALLRVVNQLIREHGGRGETG